MSDLDHAALEAAARQHKEVGRSMTVPTETLLALLEERKRLIDDAAAARRKALEEAVKVAEDADPIGRNSYAMQWAIAVAIRALGRPA